MVPSSAPYFDFSAFVWARAADFDPLIPGAVVLGPDAVANFEYRSPGYYSAVFTILVQLRIDGTADAISTSVPEPSSPLLLGCGLVVWRRGGGSGQHRTIRAGRSEVYWLTGLSGAAPYSPQ